VSGLILSNTNDAERISVITEVTFSLVPLNREKQLNPYNARYNTGLPYSSDLSRSKITDILKTARFTFVSGGEDFVYKVEPNSIKEKRQKKSAPSYG